MAATMHDLEIEVTDNPYFNFGHLQETEMMRFVHREFAILPNDWLIAGEVREHMATPDGLNLTHTEIAEAKTTGEDWLTPPIKYRRQVQWQMHVTGADRCLLVWMLRVPDGYGWFYPGWFEPKTRWIDRDPDMISDLVDVSGRLMELKNDRHEDAARTAA